MNHFENKVAIVTGGHCVSNPERCSVRSCNHKHKNLG
jgi:hypothetical protein